MLGGDEAPPLKSTTFRKNLSVFILIYFIPLTHLKILSQYALQDIQFLLL